MFFGLWIEGQLSEGSHISYNDTFHHGQWKDKLPQGQGVQISAQGQDAHSGQWEKGRLHGDVYYGIVQDTDSPEGLSVIKYLNKDTSWQRSEEEMDPEEIKEQIEVYRDATEKRESMILEMKELEDR